MRTTKPSQTLGDYVTIGISPALIMTLVGSLVFFLLEVLYGGEHVGSLKWTLFFFVFGAVLIARISIEMEGTGKAGLYGGILGLLVFIALLRFVDFPSDHPLAPYSWAINLALIALIWWSAHRLTWDCTYIDDAVDATGKGVLDAAGLEKPAQPAREIVRDVGDENEKALPPSRPRGGLFGWLDRYSDYRKAERRKPHTPGVWVVYFSFAALPLYGLGQALIPPSEGESRRYTFWLLTIYVLSGLGLLLTTNYLGLRRYLRQKKLKMPAAMTGMWLMVGGGMTLAIMLLCALIPRPFNELSIGGFSRVGSRSRDASDLALNRDGAGKGQGKASTQDAKDEQKAEDGSGTKPDEKGGQGKSSKSSKDGGSGKQGSSKDGRSREKSGDKSRDNQSGRSDNNNEDEQKKADKKNEDSGKKESGGSPAKSNEADQRRDSAKSDPSRISTLSPALQKVASILKWVVFGVLAIAFVVFLMRSGLQFLANFTDWARNLLNSLRNWWQGLFSRNPARGNRASSGSLDDRGRRWRPFSWYHNPFRDTRADSLPPEELARYSFEALQAWARERDLARLPQETPLEFATRLASEVPALEDEIRGLVGLYVRAAYARGSLTSASTTILRHFWDRLETVDAHPLSA